MDIRQQRTEMPKIEKGNCMRSMIAPRLLLRDFLSSIAERIQVEAGSLSKFSWSGSIERLRQLVFLREFTREDIAAQRSSKYLFKRPSSRLQLIINQNMHMSKELKARNYVKNVEKPIPRTHTGHRIVLLKNHSGKLHKSWDIS